MPDSDRIQRTLDYSIREGQFWAVGNGFGASYLAAFVVHLGGTALQLGILASVPQLLASLSQLVAVRLARLSGSRKRFLVVMVLLQALTWGVATIIAIVGASVWIVIGIACLFFIFGMMPAPAWSSLIGDLVPEDQRGRYFGRRNRAVGFVSFVSVAIAGFVLDALLPVFDGGAFAVLFGVAFAGRMVSVFFMSRHYDPDFELRDIPGEGIVEFLRHNGKTDFGRLARFNTVFHMAIFLIGPLFVIYFLEYLKVTYWEFSVMLAAAGISNFLTMRYWGLNADRFGNRVVLVASSWSLAMVPFMWFLAWFVPKPVLFPVAVVIQILSGLAWAGYNLSVANFQFDSVEPEYRVRRFGHYHLLQGIGIFIAGMAGGLLADSIDFGTTITSGLFFVMLVSGSLRIVVCLIFLPKLQELRKVERRPAYRYFLTVMPVEGLHADLALGFTLTKRRLKKTLRTGSQKPSSETSGPTSS